MSQGLQVFTAAGSVLFDSSWRQWRFVEQLYLPAGSSGSKYYGDIADVYELAVVVFPLGVASAGHKASVSGKTVSWQYFSFAAPLPASVASYMTVFSR